MAVEQTGLVDLDDAVEKSRCVVNGSRNPAIGHAFAMGVNYSAKFLSVR